ncbi:MAG: alpha/beta hydrolase [Hyphomicrobiaceae bacterium]|nr:alpha/beta hydrolase [Hyphomicrobiaceae bacterium]
MTKTIMLIHGAWLNAKSWEGFKARYEAKGFTVVAPSWPNDEREPAALRAYPHPELADVGHVRLIEHYERAIRALPEAPILIGHSFGGTLVQHLLDRGLGVAGVAIHPAPTSGVLVGLQTILSTLPVFGTWGSWRKVMSMSRRFFRNRFAQTAPKDQADALYDRYIVPTPGKVYWDGITNAAGKISWSNPKRPPLLLIGGGKDLIAQEAMTRVLYRKQSAAPSKTAIRVFPERSHWTCVDAGWEDVADFALDWAVANAQRPSRSLRAA